MSLRLGYSKGNIVWHRPVYCFIDLWCHERDERVGSLWYNWIDLRELLQSLTFVVERFGQSDEREKVNVSHTDSLKLSSKKRLVVWLHSSLWRKEQLIQVIVDSQVGRCVTEICSEVWYFWKGVCYNCAVDIRAFDEVQQVVASVHLIAPRSYAVDHVEIKCRKILDCWSILNRYIFEATKHSDTQTE